MTSKDASSACYVYITLSDDTKPVTAARYIWTRTRDGIPLGRFVYGMLRSTLLRQPPALRQPTPWA